MEPWGFVESEIGVSSDLDFFFGCGSSTVRLLCFDFSVSIALGLESSFLMEDLEWWTVVEVLDVVQ